MSVTKKRRSGGRTPKPGGNWQVHRECVGVSDCGSPLPFSGRGSRLSFDTGQGDVGGSVYAVLVMQLNAADNCRVAGASLEPLVLDVRPIFARGGSPCSTIDEAVASLSPGQAFVLLAPFEPAPLFAKLGAKGFCHSSKAMADGCWRIEFTPTGIPQAAGSADSCCCPGH
jgi:hypothetical protein